MQNSLPFHIFKKKSISPKWRIRLYIALTRRVVIILCQNLEATNKLHTKDIWAQNGSYKMNERCVLWNLSVDICILTGGNWQKWKRVFLTCPCHEIYRDEAVGLKSCKYTWKITIFVKMWNLGHKIHKIWYFVNNCLIEARI